MTSSTRIAFTGATVLGKTFSGSWIWSIEHRQYKEVMVQEYGEQCRDKPNVQTGIWIL